MQHSTESTARTANTHKADAPANIVTIARQPIQNEQGEVFGYELYDRTTPAHAHTADSDAALLFNALSYAGTETLVDHKTVFVNCTHESLRSTHLELIHPEKVVLEIPPLATDTEQIAAQLPTLQGLFQQGFRLAFNQDVLRPEYEKWLPLAAFIKLDMQTFAPEAGASLVAFARNHTRATLVAEKVETREQCERMAALGVALFQGYLFARPSIVQVRTVRPTQQAIEHLMALLRMHANIGQTTRLFKQEPTLLFNLLRFIHTSGFGLSCEVDSVHHALRILGRTKLFHWATLLLATSSDAINTASTSIEQSAVVRGRLMELLATQLLGTTEGHERDQAFMTGVFSLLDALLDIPLDDALQNLPLPDAVVLALLRGQGMFAPMLELTKACEGDDATTFNQAADALQLSVKQVNITHMQAIAWAEEAH